MCGNHGWQKKKKKEKKRKKEISVAILFNAQNWLIIRVSKCIKVGTLIKTIHGESLKHVECYMNNALTDNSF